MSKKRRDSKNRVLLSGESQRKDGRYVYKYIDTFGNPQFVYAWKLVPTDKTPAGKREDISLREKVKEIQKDLDDGIDTIGKKMTVCQLYAKQIRHRGNVRYNTKNGRKRLMKLLEEDKLGGCPIDSVKLSDAKEWAIRMKEKGISYKTISNDKRSLKAAFYTAIQDDCIRKKPFDFQLNTVIEDDTEPKVPLTPAQEESFLSFAQNDKVYQKYYDELIILLGTGFRISELCGLTDTDIDFENRIINVDHQLLRSGNVKKCAVGKHPKSEKLGGIESGRRLRLRPLPVLHRRQSQRVARIDPNAVVVDKNIAENDRFDLFSRQLVCRDLVDLLFFERGEKTFHPCVVETMSGAAEALYHAAARQLGTKG